MSNYPAADVRATVPLDVLTPEIRQSAMQNYYHCQRKSMWADLFGLEDLGHKEALFIGTLFHLGQTARYRGRDDASANAIIDAAALDYIEKNREHAAKSSTFDYSQTFVEKVHKDAALAKVMSQLHWQMYPLRTDRWEVVDTEGEYKLEADGIRHGGRIDLVLRHLQKPYGLVIVDHKTTKDPTKYARKLEGAVQTRLYRILLAANVDEPVLGFQYDIIQKPTIRLKKKQTFDDYLAECYEWYRGEGRHEDRAEKYLESPPILQKPIYFTEPMWPAEFRTMRDEVAAAFKRPPEWHLWPKTGELTGHCEGFDGRKCQFFELCYSHERDVPHVALTKFRTRTSGEISSDPADLEP